MKRAALYARFSSELQSEASIEDQFALCRAFSAKEGFIVVAERSDRAISGASVHGRAGLAALLEDAAAHRIDVVVVEALDRLSRDMGDLSNIWRQLQFAGVPLLAVHDGKADQVQIGVRGLVGALYLTDLANKTRRGLAGKLRAGQRAGGLPFGYRPIQGKPGEHEIFETEAAVVRRIFRAYAAGDAPREIAAALNRDGVKPNRGRAWNASTLNGSAKRCSGMLSNEVYRGVIVWNRVAKIKNPATGKRVPRINPKCDWQRVDAPHLRIIDEGLWEAVQDRRTLRQSGPKTMHRKPQRLLSGLLKCSVCGSGIVSAGNDHGRPVGKCTRTRESGDCTNKRKVYLDTIESAVLEGLRTQLLRPDVIGVAVREYHAEMRRLSGERAATRTADETRLVDLDRKIARLVEQLADGVISGAAVGQKLAQMEAEAQALRERLETAAPPDVVTLHPKAVDLYVNAIEDLARTLESGKKDEAFAVIRTLIDRIVIYPRQQGEPLRFDVAGKLIALIDPASVGTMVPRGRHTLCHRGIEPPTFLLELTA